MADRTEVRRLVREAMDLPRDVTELSGREGHHASLEPSVHGEARKIVVSRDGAEVFWIFTLDAREARPEFYPGDVPFLDDLSAVVMWDSETGLSVKWMVPGYEDRIRAFKQRVEERGTATIPKEVTELAERMEHATPEERKEQLAALNVENASPIMAWATDLFGDLAGTSFPDAAMSGLQRIARFHEESGWTVAEGESSAALRRYEMKKGAAVRHLLASSFLGLTTIDLSQRP